MIGGAEWFGWLLLYSLVAAINAFIFCAGVLVTMPRATRLQQKVRRWLFIFGALFPVWLYPALLIAGTMTDRLAGGLGWPVQPLITLLLVLTVTPVAILILGSPTRSALAAVVSLAVSGLLVLYDVSTWGLLAMLVI